MPYGAAYTPGARCAARQGLAGARYGNAVENADSETTQSVVTRPFVREVLANVVERVLFKR